MQRETLELYDIMETSKNEDSAIEDLIKENIKFIVERTVGKGKVTRVNVDITDSSLVADSPEQKSTDTFLGSYKVYFKDKSEFPGNWVADGTITNNEFELLELTIGSSELKYFGA